MEGCYCASYAHGDNKRKLTPNYGNHRASETMCSKQRRPTTPLSILPPVTHPHSQVPIGSSKKQRLKDGEQLGEEKVQDGWAHVRALGGAPRPREETWKQEAIEHQKNSRRMASRYNQNHTGRVTAPKLVYAREFRQQWKWIDLMKGCEALRTCSAIASACLCLELEATQESPLYTTEGLDRACQQSCVRPKATDGRRGINGCMHGVCIRPSSWWPLSCHLQARDKWCQV